MRASADRHNEKGEIFVEKKLSLFDLTSIGVGTVIGAGVFSMMGYGIAYTGRGITIALFLAMLLVVLQSIRYPILASVFELDGGMYAIDSLTSPTVILGFSAANDVFFKLGTQSVTVISLAMYLEILFPGLQPYRKLVAVVVLTLTFVCVLVGTKFAARVQNVMCVMMYLALALFVVYGFTHMDPAAYAEEPMLINGVPGLMMAAALMSYTCNGFQYVISMGKAAKNPKRDLPLGFFLAALIAAGLYALIGFAATHAFSYADTAGANLGDLAKLMMPHGLYMFFLVGGAIFALGTSLVGGLSASYRPLMASAKDGWLPAFFGKTTKKGTPYVLAFLYVVGIVPVLLGLDLDDLVTMQLVPLGIVIALTNVCALNTPERFAKEWKESGIKLPVTIYRVLLILAIAASAILVTYCFISNDFKVAVTIITICLFLYGFLRSKFGHIEIAAKKEYIESKSV